MLVWFLAMFGLVGGVSCTKRFSGDPFLAETGEGAVALPRSGLMRLSKRSKRIEARFVSHGSTVCGYEA